MSYFSAEIAVKLTNDQNICFSYFYLDEEQPDLYCKNKLYNMKSIDEIMKTIFDSFVSLRCDENDDDIEVGLDTVIDEYDEDEDIKRFNDFTKKLKKCKISDIKEISLGVATRTVPENSVALEWVKYDFVNQTETKGKETVECSSRYDDYDVDEIIEAVF